MPLTLRRAQLEPRIEIMPLIDVIFLLLTFFIYALILMIPARLLPMPLAELGSAEQARQLSTVAVSIDSRGGLFLDREPVMLDDIATALKRRAAVQDDLVVLLAADERGEGDRLPLFLDLYDRLAPLGLDIRLVSAPQ